MFITYFRSSSYNGWEVCQQQYFITYVLGMRAPSGKAAEKGTIVHKVMECLAQAKLAIQNDEDHFVDDSLGRYDIDPDRMWHPEFFSKLVIDSWEYYTAEGKTVNRYTEKDFRDCETWSHKVTHQCGGAFDPRNRNVLAPEPHFDLTIDEPWAHYSYDLPDGRHIEGQLSIKGTIDLVTLAGEDVVETIDWKTGRRINWGNMQEKTFEKLNFDAQLCMYHYALSRMYPQYKHFAMTINFMNDGGPFTMSYGPDKFEYTMELLKKRFEEIKNSVRPRLRTGFFCNRVCHFGKNQHPKDGTQTICKYIHNKIRRCGLNQTILDETEEGFDLNYYQNPGE